MAKKSVKERIDIFENEKILSQNLEDIMGDCFGRYSKYIIQDRALPDVRDGLKPVQRRILYAMYMLGMFPNTQYKKSARVVGEVIGKYHPHGDTSVYDAIVRMSQDFKMGEPLIDMHGNNGSIDGDSAAAMRYTEARLSKLSMELLKDLDKKTVQFVPNFDDCEYEPVVLPARFPNLLVNGASGISAGYATNIPPHNVHEVINLAIERIKNPKLTIDEAMTIIKGPDFPTGGIIEGTDEIRKAFETGQGKVYVKSKVRLEDNLIIIEEIPYEVVKATLVRKIDEVRINKKIDGIIEVRDESDKDGLRIVIETKKQSNPEVILNYLYKNTDLAVNFNYNMVVIDQKAPKLYGILPIIDAYILHQKEVVRNRSNFDLDKAKRRLHIVEGFIKMVSVVDQVIHVIRNSNNKADSKINIQNKFGFTELQAEAIVTMQLYRLSHTDIVAMQEEEKELKDKIAELERILSNEKLLEKVIIKSLEEVSASVQTERRTEIKEEVSKIIINEEELFIHENVRVIITKDGYVKRMSLRAYQSAVGISQPGLKENDLIIYNEEINTKDTLLLFTSLGNVINVRVYKLPEVKYKDMGIYLGSLFDLAGVESIIGVEEMTHDFDHNLQVLLATKKGLIKQTSLNEIFLKQNKKANCMSLRGDDELVSYDIETKYDEDIICVSKRGMIIKYTKDEVPEVGLSAQGVKAFGLRSDDEVVSATYSSDYYKDEILLLTNKGCIKRVPVSQISSSRRTNRGTMFLKVVKTNPYYFVKHVATNLSKLKDAVRISVISSERVLEIKGSDMVADRYEHGIPTLESYEKPLSLLLKVLDENTFNKVMDELDKNKIKKAEEEQEEVSSNLLTDLTDILNDKQMSIFDIENEESKEEEKETNEFGIPDDEMPF